MFFLQMSGFPGSGKSALAREIAGRTGAVVIDHDVTKTALLETPEGAGMDGKTSGSISYHIDWSIIESILSQERNVIFDSPCLYQEMIIKGTNLARKYRASYKYVKCFLDDFDLINERLKNRERKISQIREVKSLEGFKKTLENSKKPEGHRYLVVDTSMGLDTYIDEVMEYLVE
ncbi:AAA family ATPase [Rossellomorea aquimaris]|uniref:ATP-binding protein n=1 Tax=Rossellomorea aquimaris TaxID=189382 RepID=A0A1J6VTH4_9BACI|nr:AAA family ATPase [Rossellomorea aquimaris]OIU68581.1 ATP-binding protein [Rossellomorea aquimaris]